MKGQTVSTNPNVSASTPHWLSRSVLISFVVVLAISLGGVRTGLSEANAGNEDPPTWSVLPEPILRSAIGFPIRQIEAHDADADGFPELFALISSQNASVKSATLAAYGSSEEGCKGTGCSFGEISARTFQGLSFHNLAGPALEQIQERGLYSGTGDLSLHNPASPFSQASVAAGDGLFFVLTQNGRPRERYLHRLVYDGQTGTFGDAPVMDSSRFPSNQLCKLARRGKLGGQPGVYWLAYSDLSSAPCDFWPDGSAMTDSRDLYWQAIDDEGMLVSGTKVRLLTRTTARALAIGEFYADADDAENNPEIVLLEGDVGDERIAIYQVEADGNSLAGVEVCTLGKTRTGQSTHGLVDIAVGWLNKDQRLDIVGIKTDGSPGAGRSSQLATWTMKEDWVPGMRKAECGGIFAFEEQAIPEAINQNSRLALYNGDDANYLFVNVPTESLSESRIYLHTSERPRYETLPAPTLEVSPVVDSQDGEVRAAVRILVGNLLPGAEVEVRRSTQGADYCMLTALHETSPCEAEEDAVSCRLDEDVLSNQEYTYCVRTVAQDMAPSPVVQASAETPDVEAGCPVEVGPAIATSSVWTYQHNGVDQGVVRNSPFVQSGIEFHNSVEGRFNYQSAIRFDLRGIAYPTDGAVLDDVILRLKGTGTGWDQSWGAPFEIGIWDTTDDSLLWEAPSATAILAIRGGAIVYDMWKLQPYPLYWGQVFQEDHHVAEGKVNRLHFRDLYEPDEDRQARLHFVEAILNGQTDTTTMTIVIQRPNATGLVDTIRPGQTKWAKWGSVIGDPNRGDPYDLMPQLIFKFKTCPGP